jgi:hypothetical protein
MAMEELSSVLAIPVKIKEMTYWVLVYFTLILWEIANNVKRV